MSLQIEKEKFWCHCDKLVLCGMIYMYFNIIIFLTMVNIMLEISISELPVEENLYLLYIYAKYYIYTDVNIEN